jgi:hypothetical protein
LGVDCTAFQAESPPEAPPAAKKGRKRKGE